MKNKVFWLLGEDEARTRSTDDWAAAQAQSNQPAATAGATGGGVHGRARLLSKEEKALVSSVFQW